MTHERDGATWDPDQYLRFSDHRLRPAVELLARVPLVSPDVIVDLGCGAGNVTRLLAERWLAARIVGVDHSREMLDQARATSSRIEWVEADLASWESDGGVDLLFSNAALHWVDGHRAIFPRLAGQVREGGALAVQMPLSHDHPSHRLMRETLVDGGAGGSALGSAELRASASRRPVESTEVYLDLLAARARDVDAWETTYFQLLEGEDAVLEWVRGTGLRPILHALDEGERATFLSTYRRRLLEAYPPRADGRTVYPFRRLFLVARF